MEAKRTTQTEKLARELATQASTVDELNSLLRGLMKSALECMLDSELDAHLQRKEPPLPFEPPAPNNRRNGHSKKTVHGALGEVHIDVPRDRKQYPSADSAVKLVWLAISEASQKWTMPIVGWKQALNHFAILFEGRLPAKPNN